MHTVTRHRTLRALVLAVIATGLVGIAAPASAHPIDTGCAAGFETLSVDELAQQGYGLPPVIDGEGNGDGWICGRPLPHAVNEAQGFPTGVQLYLFGDNDVAAASR